MLHSFPTPLPLDGIREVALFEIVGIDFAGKTFFKGGQKAWICIFTCAVYRAVHFGLTNSPNVAAILMAMRCFSALKDRSSVIFFDNGKIPDVLIDILKGLLRRTLKR